MTQKDLAAAIGTRQSAISRVEDPAYGRINLATLGKIADVFKCALLLRFVPYDQFAEQTRDTSMAALTVKPFERNP
jgi:transcriptional regulator with XRE-family HTH domain